MVLPILGPAPATLRDAGSAPVVDLFVQGLAVAYSYGPPYGQRYVTHDDLGRMELTRRGLRRVATEALDRMASLARVHGKPPSLMLSCNGLESSLLLAERFWARLAATVPGELVIGVPARDVVICTGSLSRPGLAKVRRAVDRVFLAGGANLLTPDLLVFRQGRWHAYDAPPVGAQPEPTNAPHIPEQRRWQQPGPRVATGRRR
jgi:uncharacterized protein YtpQ (UPF0354 family)